MKYLNISVIAIFVTMFSASQLANANITSPKTQRLKCGEKAFYYSGESKNDLLVLEISKATLNNRGLKEYTHDVKAMMSPYDKMGDAVLQCHSGSLMISMPNSRRSNETILLITKAGRVLNISARPPVITPPGEVPQIDPGDFR